MPIDVEQHVAAGIERLDDGLARCCVLVIEHARPFEQVAAVAAASELGVVDERVVAAVDLAGTRRSCVVTDIDIAMPGSDSISRRDKVVLPAPDGEDRTNNRPRRAMVEGVAVMMSLDVLHLFAHLIDRRLQRETGARDVGIVATSSKAY